MRTKHEILNSMREDLRSKTFKEEAPLWMQYRLIEVLVDIRDILEQLRREKKDENKG